jgi:uncharacterized membrane protein AbrB (regulator of aidB expression)
MKENIMKWLNDILGTYYQPDKVFEGMKDKPRWLVPLIVSVLFTLAVTAIILPTIVIPEQAARLADNPDIPAEQLENIQAKMSGPLPLVAGLVSNLVLVPAGLMLIGLVFWGIFSMLGHQASFKQMFTAAVYGSLIGIPGAMVKVPLMFIQGTAKISTSLGLILPAEMEEGFWVRLLNHIDLFTIWTLAVMAIGFSVFAGASRTRSYWVVFGCWAVFILILSAVGGAFRVGPQ